MTTAGARHSEVDGMSQMSFHSQSQFGKADLNNGDASSQGSRNQTVFTKPFTVGSNKGSEKSKLP